MEIELNRFRISDSPFNGIGYHVFTKRDNASWAGHCTLWIDRAVLVVAIWYLFIPLVWESATAPGSGRVLLVELVSARTRALPQRSAVPAATISRAGLKGCSRTIDQSYFLPAKASFSRYRQRANHPAVQSIIRQLHLNRCIGYIQTARQRQQELLASLSADEQTLSTLLESRRLRRQFRRQSSRCAARWTQSWMSWVICAWAGANKRRRSNRLALMICEPGGIQRCLYRELSQTETGTRAARIGKRP